jgi:hypothetical protein
MQINQNILIMIANHFQNMEINELVKEKPDSA